MRHLLTLLLCASAFTIALCQNDTSRESREVREFPEIEIGRVRRSTKIYGDKGVYCAAYRPNFEYYCVGIWSGEKLSMSSRHSERIKKFCPTYKHHCISHRGRSTHHRKHSRRYRAGSEEELRSKSYEDILKELSEIVPCTPECNPNVHPHCTQECKCDYDYPRMQRFCNPPALPMFLNVCRLWYNQCPKYERYHYASQFIYSKAEKGKTVATPLPVVDEAWRQSFYRRQG